MEVNIDTLTYTNEELIDEVNDILINKGHMSYTQQSIAIINKIRSYLIEVNNG